MGNEKIGIGKSLSALTADDILKQKNIKRKDRLEKIYGGQISKEQRKTTKQLAKYIINTRDIPQTIPNLYYIIANLQTDLFVILERLKQGQSLKPSNRGVNITFCLDFDGLERKKYEKIERKMNERYNSKPENKKYKGNIESGSFVSDIPIYVENIAYIRGRSFNGGGIYLPEIGDDLFKWVDGNLVHTKELKTIIERTGNVTPILLIESTNVGISPYSKIACVRKRFGKEVNICPAPIVISDDCPRDGYNKTVNDFSDQPEGDSDLAKRAFKLL